MAINEATIAKHNENYKELTREAPKGMICPITLRDIPLDELCNGHILNEGLKEASRVTIPQPRDLDSHFGATIEADLVKYPRSGKTAVASISNVRKQDFR